MSITISAIINDMFSTSCRKHFFSLSKGSFSNVCLIDNFCANCHRKKNIRSCCSSPFRIFCSAVSNPTGSNNKERDISSLSGGESFQASLALALGLSDIIQQRNGGIRLDSIFIDEGFGSLDNDKLASAIETLNNLTGNGNRLVGIISHISELKNSIGNKIEVVGTKSGSSIKIITD